MGGHARVRSEIAPARFGDVDGGMTTIRRIRDRHGNGTAFRRIRLCVECFIVNVSYLSDPLKLTSTQLVPFEVFH